MLGVEVSVCVLRGFCLWSSGAGGGFQGEKSRGSHYLSLFGIHALFQRGYDIPHSFSCPSLSHLVLVLSIYVGNKSSKSKTNQAAHPQRRPKDQMVHSQSRTVAAGVFWWNTSLECDHQLQQQDDSAIV